MNDTGFSLVEVLVATAVVVVGVASLAQLIAVSARASRIADVATTTLLLAQHKMEELRADGAESSPSPPEALSSNIAGYFDYVDRIGLSLGGDTSTPPAGALYVRRWAIEPLEGSGALGGIEGSAGNSAVLNVLKVLVFELTSSGITSEGSGMTRSPVETRLVSIKVRKVG